MSIKDLHAEFSLQMTDCLTFKGNPFFPQKIAVAVSGGPDSMALCHLTMVWAKQQKEAINVVALIVDHGLRAEAASEAEAARDVITSWGINAVILREAGRKIERNIQSEARSLRYELLQEWCLNNHVPVFMTAHHRQDQMETFLLRLSRGSGVKGLSSMQPARRNKGLLHVRPILSWSKEKIWHYIEENSLPYASDPSNENVKFDRIKIRKALPLLAELGLTEDRVSQTAHRLSKLDKFLDKLAYDFSRKATDLWPIGMLRCDRVSFKDLEEEVAFRALGQWFMLICDTDYPPRAQKLWALLERLRGAEPHFIQTLGGCRIQTRKHDFLLIPNRQSAQEGAIGPIVGFLTNLPVDEREDVLPCGFDVSGSTWRSCLEAVGNQCGDHAPLKQDETSRHQTYWAKLGLPGSAMSNIPVMVGPDGEKIWPRVEKNRLVWQKNAQDVTIHALLQDYYSD